MKLFTTTLFALTLAAPPTLAAPLPYPALLSHDALTAGSMFNLEIGLGLVGRGVEEAHDRRDGMYHLGEGDFENPQPAPPVALLDGLLRRQAAPAAAPAAKPSPGLVGSLGLADALAPLGLGGLLPGVESAVGGIPVIGAPVAGIVSGADNAAGVTALLSPKDDANATAPASAATHVKRQQQPSDGLVGTLGLDGALASLGLGGLLGTVEQTVDDLPLVGPLVGGLLGTVDSTVGLSALLSPPPVVGKRDLEQTVRGTVPLSTVLGVLYTLEGTGGSLAATVQGAPDPITKPATAALAASPLGGLSIAEAEALGLLPAGFANSLLATKVDTTA